MANPTYVAAFVATVSGIISSKFAIDAVANTTEDEIDEMDDEERKEKVK